MNKDEFVSTMAKICYFAQGYSRDWDVDCIETVEHLKTSFEHVSHVIACFLAHSTVGGSSGVESNVVLDQLVNEILNLDEWCTYFNKLIDDLEYDNCNYSC